MRNERGEGDVQYVVTCTYCGTETRFSFKQIESGNPLECRACGAPFKVVPPKKPPKKRAEKGGEPFYDYSVIQAERRMYESQNEGGLPKAAAVGVAIVGGIVYVIFLLSLLFQRCR